MVMTLQKKHIALHEVKTTELQESLSTDQELNRVLGGGIVPGSIVLVAGEPGIGKSLCFLQMGLQLKDIVTLYISGEESEQQIKMRADRLNMKNENFYLLQKHLPSNFPGNKKTKAATCDRRFNSNA